MAEQWTQPAHIVSGGPFKVRSWKPYNELVLERDPMYWDAAKVGLDGITFYPLSDLPTALNLYKLGEVDALQNHSIPSWCLDIVRLKKDYMDAPEAASIFLYMNTTKAPMNDLRVRRASIWRSKNQIGSPGSKSPNHLRESRQQEYFQVTRTPKRAVSILKKPGNCSPRQGIALLRMATAVTLARASLWIRLSIVTLPYRRTRSWVSTCRRSGNKVSA